MLMFGLFFVLYFVKLSVGNGFYVFFKEILLVEDDDDFIICRRNF